MHFADGPAVAVILPGTGSDAAFIRDAFTAPLARYGYDLIAIEPDPYRVVGSYLDALDDAAQRWGRILVGGVSIGAAVAIEWARTHPAGAAGVLAALPPWTGEPHDAPAALSARYTAKALHDDGLAAVTERMRASSPTWLADTLTRSWATHGEGLPAALAEAAAYIAPTTNQLREVTAAVGIAAADDDAVHPARVAQTWAQTLPTAAIETLSLNDLAVDPAALGRAAVTAFARLV